MPRIRPLPPISENGQSGLLNKDKYFINREISWLHFNERVLQEALDVSTPLIERIKFLGIYSNNRDEFFRVRIATLKRMIKLQEKQPVPDTRYEKTLSEVLEIVAEQEETFTSAYQDNLKELAKNNIFFLSEKELSKTQGEYVRDFFRQRVKHNLFPLLLSNFRNISAIQDAVVYLAIQLRDSSKELPDEHALIQIPSDSLGRFILLPSEKEKTSFIFLDDVIRYNLDEIFAVTGYDRYNAYTIKMTRDSELDIDNDVSKSFLELMRESVKKRKSGEAVRFIYDRDIPEPFLKRLLKKFNITSSGTLRAGPRYHNFRDFMDFPRIGPPGLRYPPAPPLLHPDLRGKKSMFEVIRQKDVMINFPYQTYEHIIDLLREASIDPAVRSIKMTFYRTTRDSSAMNALINAARNGKFVTVFMEIQARFDEEANIYWTQRLQEEGIKIIQTIPGFKVHAKLILIRRREGAINKLYANVSTGNYNETTARVFSDFSLLTADKRITDDVYNIFELLESKFIMPTFNTLKVSPFGLREFFLEHLENEIRNAGAGKEAWAILKLNSLVDKRCAAKLYEASQAGVRIDLINRGMCVIKPGVKGLSENIHAFSIVDKYLEHSRVYIFCNGGKPKYYISSADWMQRNFDHRIEVVCPVFDKPIQKLLRDILHIQMQDNVKARLLGPRNLNKYRKTSDKDPHRAQFEIYEYLERMNG